MVKKLKRIGIILISAVMLIITGVLIALTAGKNKKIKSLLKIITNTLQKNIIEKEEDNKNLDQAWEKLSDQEKAIIIMIKDEPNLAIPKEIDPRNYKAVLKWFRSLERKYD